LDWLNHGFLGFSAWEIFAFTLTVTQITIVSVTVYLHRYSSHRSLELHSGLKHFFRFWLWLTTGMVTRQWTAIHRKHHAVCETEEDPHSPVCRGIGEIFWRGTEAYQEAAKDKALLARYGSGCPEDWLERHVYENNTVGVVFMLFIDLLLFGVAGLTVWAVQMLWIPVFAAGVINGIGHWWGYRNFECPDASRNIVPWGVLIGGEELHNNHHTYPNSAKLSVKPFEVDIGWFWIQLFVKLDLAWVVSTGPVVERVPDKNLLDKDAAWALLNDRFRVMARYAEEVVAPVIEQELQKADDATRKMYKKARVLLCREVTLLDAKSKERLTALVDRNADLRVIYEAHQRLQAIWAKRGGNIEEVVAELVTWCREAEASGTQALNDFAATLKSYAIPQAQSA